MLFSLELSGTSQASERACGNSDALIDRLQPRVVGVRPLPLELLAHLVVLLAGKLAAGVAFLENVERPHPATTSSITPASVDLTQATGRLPKGLLRGPSAIRVMPIRCDHVAKG